MGVSPWWWRVWRSRELTTGVQEERRGSVLIMAAAFPPSSHTHSTSLPLLIPLQKGLYTPRGVFYNLLGVFQTNQVDNQISHHRRYVYFTTKRRKKRREQQCIEKGSRRWGAGGEGQDGVSSLANAVESIMRLTGAFCHG